MKRSSGLEVAVSLGTDWVTFDQIIGKRSSVKQLFDLRFKKKAADRGHRRFIKGPTHSKADLMTKTHIFYYVPRTGTCMRVCCIKYAYIYTCMHKYNIYIYIYKYIFLKNVFIIFLLSYNFAFNLASAFMSMSRFKRPTSPRLIKLDPPPSSAAASKRGGSTSGL